MAANRVSSWWSFTFEKYRQFLSDNKISKSRSIKDSFQENVKLQKKTRGIHHSHLFKYQFISLSLNELNSDGFRWIFVYLPKSIRVSSHSIQEFELIRICLIGNWVDPLGKKCSFTYETMEKIAITREKRNETIWNKVKQNTNLFGLRAQQSRVKLHFSFH